MEISIQIKRLANTDTWSTPVRRSQKHSQLVQLCCNQELTDYQDFLRQMTIVEDFFSRWIGEGGIYTKEEKYLWKTEFYFLPNGAPINLAKEFIEKNCKKRKKS